MEILDPVRVYGKPWERLTWPEQYEMIQYAILRDQQELERAAALAGVSL